MSQFSKATKLSDTASLSIIELLSMCIIPIFIILRIRNFQYQQPSARAPKQTLVRFEQENRNQLRAVVCSTGIELRRKSPSDFPADQSTVHAKATTMEEKDEVRKASFTRGSIVSGTKGANGSTEGTFIEETIVPPWVRAETSPLKNSAPRNHLAISSVSRFSRLSRA